MKALSIVAPSGTKIALGEKTVEVRSWVPELEAESDLLIVENSVFLRNEGDVDPAGKAVAIVKVAQVRPFLPKDVESACASYWAEGYYSWILKDVRRFAYPEPLVAARGIYELELIDTAIDF